MQAVPTAMTSRDKVNAESHDAVKHFQPGGARRIRHLVLSLRVVGEDSGGLDTEANFLVVRTMQDGDMTIFAAGRYVDRVVPDGANWKFARKEVVLDSRQIDTLLAIPI